ncbi:MAG: OmpA family protein [Rhodobacteraceae bacterium]|nr:OmpA family protein [Paracoccaceae bacterium]
MRVRALSEWIRIAVAVALCAGSASAMELALPGVADAVAEDRRAGASVALPISGWSDGAVETLSRDGVVTRRVWRMRGTDATPLQIFEAVAGQIEEAGFTPLFQCHDAACGGFDFRFSLDLIGEPHMHVDLRNFRYGLAEADDALVSFVVSRSATDAFLHLTEVTTDAEAAPLAVTSVLADVAPSPAPLSDLAQMLNENGHAPLPDVVFAAGSSRFQEGSVPSLSDLAGYLVENEKARVLLVGHTDADGSLSANVGLSQARAAAVRQRLIDAHGVDGARIRAEGVGYLAPIASNETDEGREANRRVEVVLDR